MYNLGMPNQMGYSIYDSPQRFPQTPNSLVRVNGIEGAKAYQMMANSTVALFDGNEDLFYVKSTDGAGFPTIRTFRFEEVSTNEPKASSNYVSREEMEEYVQQFISKSTATKQTDTANATSSKHKSEQS